MKVTLALLEFCLVASEVCSVYKCGDLSAGVCASRTERLGEYTISLKPCTQDKQKICNLQTWKGDEILCTEFRSAALKPGEYCVDSSECVSYNCDDYVCIGKEEAENCDLTAECNPGLYCGNGKCTKLLRDGDACSVNHKCQVTSICDHSVCVQIGSKALGETAEDFRACSTLFVHDGKCASGTKIVETQASLKCAKSTCLYTLADTSEIITEACKCGYSESTEKFCNPGTLNVNTKDYLDYVKSEEPALYCHVEAGPLCAYMGKKEMGMEYYRAVAGYLNLTRGFAYLGNAECVKKMYNAEYWTAVEFSTSEVRIHLKIAIIVIIAWVLLGAISILLMSFCLLKLRIKKIE